MKKFLMTYLNGLRYYLYNYIISYFPSNNLRIFYLRNFLLAKIGKECFIHMGVFIGGDKLEIGNNTVIGRQCYLGSGGGKLVIGDNVSLTAQTYIFCSSHKKNSPSFELSYGDVIIKDYAWIGARAMILPNIVIGKGAILGANSTLTKNIPDFTIFAGSPAKKVGERKRNLKYKLKYFPYFQ